MKRPEEPKAEHPTSVAVVFALQGREHCIGWTYRDQRDWRKGNTYKDRGDAVKAALRNGFCKVVDDATGAVLARVKR